MPMQSKHWRRNKQKRSRSKKFIKHNKRAKARSTRRMTNMRSNQPQRKYKNSTNELDYDCYSMTYMYIVCLHYSLIVLPVEDFLALLVLPHILDSLVLWLHESVPLRPLGMLCFLVLLLVRVTLVECHQLVQVREEVYEQTALLTLPEEVL